jgi:flagellar hook assembly protein FlgD
VVLHIYDVRGARVATLLDEAQAEGSHTVDWAGVDDAGRRVPSGTYFAALTAGKETVSRKMAVLR